MGFEDRPVWSNIYPSRDYVKFDIGVYENKGGLYTDFQSHVTPEFARKVAQELIEAADRAEGVGRDEEPDEKESPEEEGCLEPLVSHTDGHITVNVYGAGSTVYLPGGSE